MEVLVLIGRVVFALLFLGSGFGHLTQRQMMAGYATGKGVPAANLMVPLTGLQLLAGALMVALGIWPDVGALLLVTFLVPTAFIMHGFWAETDPGAKAMEQTQFLKDLALAGAALVMFAVFAYLGDDLGLVLVGPLFSLS
ncbi:MULTISPECIES: DoxX family protein [Cellulomonadaceae]|uniref:DoxX family protein n=2 Tax=Cellulomonadaceae TaxID=85016 RepID=A0A021VVW1_9CELL|nr:MULTISPECIES: DoxX family protein [Cellulomonadaceae]EYR65301.1 DoxX family protein [Actinotalea ferrariae CF5-4]KGM12735.1 DoxX family protein [Cellulomonas carbonis T26]MDT0166036.1 DoxX family protein [Actinotalea sp. AC32]GGC13938.1 membrane protein [Cellulomonas carbonis]